MNAVADFIESEKRSPLLCKAGSSDQYLRVHHVSLIRGFRSGAIGGLACPLLYLAWKYFTKKNPSPGSVINDATWSELGWIFWEMRDFVAR